MKSSLSDIYSLAVELNFFMYWKTHISYKRLLICKSVNLFIVYEALEIYVSHMFW